jgi:hypothetical protein
VIVSHDSTDTQDNGAVAVSSAPPAAKIDPDDEYIMRGTYRTPYDYDNSALIDYQDEEFTFFKRSAR